MNARNREDVPVIAAEDGSFVRELARAASHSLAEIRHPPGTASREHFHRVSDEIYYVLDGQGEIRVDDETHALRPGDLVTIGPGRRHKVWPHGRGALVLLVTCAPAYSLDDVVFTE